MEYMYEYSYRMNEPFSHSTGSELTVAIMAVYLIIIAGVAVIGLVGYIFHSFGMYTIGKRLDRPYPWLAFVPFAREYFQGELAGEIMLKNTKIRNPGIWNLILPVIFSVLTGILTVILLFFTMGGVLTAALAGNGSILMLALSGLIIFYFVLIVFSLAYSAVYMVLTILINRQIFARFTTENMAIVHAVLSAVIPLYEAFCTFTFRNKEFRI